MRGRLRRLGWTVLFLALVAGIGTLLWQVLRGGVTTMQRPVTTVMRVVLPPPPPPKPQPPPPPQPQKMIEAPKPTQVQTPKPQQAKQAPPKAPSAVPRPPGNPLTAEAGPGPNPYGLGVGNGEGDTIGGGGGGGGSRLGYYAGLIANEVQTALQSNDATRYARLRGLRVRLWLTASGQVSRSELVTSTGVSATDTAVSRVLSSVSLHEAWPADLPQPVVIRIGTQG